MKSARFFRVSTNKTISTRNYFYDSFFSFLTKIFPSSKLLNKAFNLKPNFAQISCSILPFESTAEPEKTCTCALSVGPSVCSLVSRKVCSAAGSPASTSRSATSSKLGVAAVTCEKRDATSSQPGHHGRSRHTGGLAVCSAAGLPASTSRTATSSKLGVAAVPANTNTHWIHSQYSAAAPAAPPPRSSALPPSPVHKMQHEVTARSYGDTHGAWLFATLPASN